MKKILDFLIKSFLDLIKGKGEEIKVIEKKSVFIVCGISLVFNIVFLTLVFSTGNNPSSSKQLVGELYSKFTNASKGITTSFNIVEYMQILTNKAKQGNSDLGDTIGKSKIIVGDLRELTDRIRAENKTTAEGIRDSIKSTASIAEDNRSTINRSNEIGSRIESSLSITSGLIKDFETITKLNRPGLESNESIRIEKQNNYWWIYSGCGGFILCWLLFKRKAIITLFKS